LSEEARQIGEKRREAKGKGEKERWSGIPIWLRIFQLVVIHTVKVNEA